MLLLILSRRYETTYTPSGDENCSSSQRFMSAAKQLTPRQGTKTRHSAGLSLQSQALRNNLHPVRGRKPCVELHALWVDKKQLMPRQGTKTTQDSRSMHPSQKQLTPRQGTKNLYPFMLNPSCLKQLTPRQGTKTRTSISKVLPCDETTYTPSGDENLPELVCFATAKIRNNLRPVRGRKLHFVRLNALHLSGNNLHPVRGRKSGQP